MQSVASEAVKSKIDFLKYRYMWLGISVLYLFIGIAAYLVKGGFNYHIDFTGGAELRISFEKPVSIARIRTVMAEQGWKDAIIQNADASDQKFIVRVAVSTDRSTESRIKEALLKVTDNKSNIDGIQWVGAEAGQDTTKNAVLAVLLALLVLLLYIAARFELRFGIGAVVSLVHDVLAVLTFLLLTGEPISLHILASVLAVLGYSNHDSIVIFNRIKENFKKYRGSMSEYDIANLSINQTLKRTLLTSFATLLSVLAIYLLGGEALRGLSLVMLVGIIVGTYSSIYIASPVMLAIKRGKSL